MRKYSYLDGNHILTCMYSILFCELRQENGASASHSVVIGLLERLGCTKDGNYISVYEIPLFFCGLYA